AHLILRSSDGEADAPVLLALALGLADADTTDFARPADMGSAAGLKIDAATLADRHQAHPSRAGGRLDRHGADKAGIGRELLVGDPLLDNRMVFLDQAVDLALEPVARHGTRVGNIEIESSAVGRDLPPGHRELDEGAQEMERGVHAHMPVA